MITGAHTVICSKDPDAVDDRGWGLLTSVALPGGGRLGIYQARHERPENP